MALMRCPSCGLSFAPVEKFCAACGEQLEPQAPQMSLNKRVIIVVCILGGLAGLALLGVLLTSSPSNMPDAAETPQISEKDKADLKAARDRTCRNVDQLTQSGVFTKIEGTGADVTHAYVDHAFYALTVDQKKIALGAVAACHLGLEKRNQLGLVIIRDGYSGKRIGTYSIPNGLDLD